MEEYLAILEKTKLFCGIERRKITSLCRDMGCFSRVYQRGNFLWQQGESVKNAGVVLYGCVRAEKTCADGSSVIVASHGAGALFGDILMSSERVGSPISLVAEEESRVLFLPFAHTMREGASKERDALERFRFNLLGEMSEKYWLLYRKLGYLSVHGMRKRLSLWMLDEADENGCIVCAMGREELASFLGVNRSALCRELSRMRAEGLIETARGRIVVLEREILSRLAE